MVNIRTAQPSQQELWDVPEIANYLNCDEMKAKEVIKEIKVIHDHHGYGPIPKEWVIEYKMVQDKLERERDARHQSDIANAKSFVFLEEQVKIHQKVLEELKKMNEAASRQARQAKLISVISIVVAAISTVIAALLPLL